MANGNIYQDTKPTSLVSSKFYAIISLILILSFVIYKYAFVNSKQTCENYIFNSYLYLVLSTTIIFSIVIFNEYTHFYSPVIKAFKYSNILVPIAIIIIQLSIIGLLKYELKKTEHKDVVKSHILWVLIMIMMGLFLIPIMYFANIKHVANPLLIIGTLWSVVMIAKNIFSNNGVDINWSYILVISLIIYFASLVILPLIGYYFSNGSKMMDSINTILKMETVVVVVLLLLLNHIAITDNYYKCVDKKITPNYPEESFDFFLLIKNIVSDFFNKIGLCSYEYRKYLFQNI
jgi:hypothetical protein